MCPNLPHSSGIFVKFSNSIIILLKSFLGHFYRHLAIFSGHIAYKGIGDFQVHYFLWFGTKQTEKGI